MMVSKIDQIPDPFPNLPTEPRVALSAPVEMPAGPILNLYMADYGPVNGVAIIRSRAGSTRSRHLHLTDWHLLYVLSGEVHYYERTAGSKENPDPHVFREGEMFFTGPMVEHAVYFPVDTVLISISRNARDEARHEQDVVRVEFPLPTD